MYILHIFVLCLIETLNKHLFNFNFQNKISFGKMWKEAMEKRRKSKKKYSNKKDTSRSKRQLSPVFSPMSNQQMAVLPAR